MPFSMLPSLRPGDWQAVICVRVCRKWEYRGGTDDGPIQHVDLVLLDEQGNSLYGEIPGTEVEAKSPLIQQDGIYVISRFRVSNAKSAYRAVNAPYMVEFTLHTTVTAARTDMAAFPKYAYKITPIDSLPSHAGDTKNFLDTIGALIEVSDIQAVHMPNRPSTVARHIVLRDLSYSEIKITLWGQKATAFSIEGVYTKDEAKPVIVLFVGGLMKSYQGSYYLSANSACRWYFNPEIPEARPLYESFNNQRLEIRSVASPKQMQTQRRATAQLEEKNLRQLNQINPYNFPDAGYRCTVTIGRLAPNTTWWFPSCNKCSKACAPDGAGYKCGPCSNTSFKFKYKICFVALDGTDEADMVCFGDIARCIVGKPVQQLLRTSTSSKTYPSDITKLVSLRFTFAVTMSHSSYYRPKKTYNVAALVTSHGHAAAGVNNVEQPNQDGSNDDALAESGDSSSKSAVQETPPSSAPLTPASIISPGLSKAPLLMSDDLETPVSKKNKRGTTSNSNKQPACRRKLLLGNDDSDDSDPATAVEDTPGASTAADKVQASDGEHSSPEHSPAHTSG